MSCLRLCGASFSILFLVSVPCLISGSTPPGPKHTLQQFTFQRRFLNYNVHPLIKRLAVSRQQYNKQLSVDDRQLPGLDFKHNHASLARSSRHDGFVRIKRSSTLKLCGDTLIIMLRYVCQGGNRRRRRRRDAETRSFWISRDSFANFVENRGMGLTDRCCHHSCSMLQLREACSFFWRTSRSNII